MRVLVLCARHPPEHAGGYELQCAGSVAHLRRHGDTVRVLTSGPPQPGDAAGDVHRELRRFPAVPVSVAPAEAERDERHNRAVLARHLGAFAPDVVAAWRLGELSVSLVADVHAAGVPLVGVVCDPWLVEAPERDPWARMHDARVAVDRGRWLFVSAALRRATCAAGAIPARSAVVHAGIEAAVPAPAPPPKPWRGRVLYAGRLSPLKGVDVAVRAAAGLPPGATLTVVGGGSVAYEAELRALAAGSSRVRFDGPCAHARMPAVLADADIVVFPSVWAEPWGLVPLEAMAAGTPVVATGTGGSAEYLRDGENTLLVAPADADALAAATTRLAGDPALRARLVHGGLETARRHPAEASHAAIRAALLEEARSGATPPAAAPTLVG